MRHSVAIPAAYSAFPSASSSTFWSTLRQIARVLAAAALFSPAAAFAVPIDMNQMFHDPGVPISISADGSSATFREDPALLSVFLSDVPGFGDPELLQASAGARLAFDYNFLEPAGNADIFHFAILDGTSGNPLAPFDLFFTDTGAGSVSFDLTSLVGSSLGFQFELVSDVFNDLGFDSLLTISNLRIEPPDVVAVPEPDIFGMVLLGLALLTVGAARAPRRSVARS